MPIYAYKCESCGHAKDVLQKMSDDPLSVCPACGNATFRKQAANAASAAAESSKPAGESTTPGATDTSAAPASAPAPAAAAPAAPAVTPAAPPSST
jgi:putative FmdB family regulatory protein